MTHHNSVSASCHTLLQRLDVLRGDGTIRPGMHELVTSIVKKIAHYGEIFLTYPLEERTKYGRRLALDLLDVEAVVEALSQNRRVANLMVKDLLKESVEQIIGPNQSMDLVVISSQSRSSTLKSFIHSGAGDLSFVLFLSPVLDYTTLPLLPRVVHEAAHADQRIARLSASEVEIVFRHHLAEVLCDTVALLVAGPSFLFSSEGLLQNLGDDAWRLATNTQPSLATRASVLDLHARTLWNNTRLAETIREVLARITAIACSAEEFPSQRRLKTESEALLPDYMGLATGSPVWEQIYVDRNIVREDSIVVKINVDFARLRTGR